MLTQCECRAGQGTCRFEYRGVGRYARDWAEEFGSAFRTLSAREREVLHLIAEGRETKRIAAELRVSVNTVETNRRNLTEKLGVGSVAELTKYAVRQGLTGV